MSHHKNSKVILSITKLQVLAISLNFSSCLVHFTTPSSKLHQTDIEATPDLLRTAPPPPANMTSSPTGTTRSCSFCFVNISWSSNLPSSTTIITMSLWAIQSQNGLYQGLPHLSVSTCVPSDPCSAQLMGQLFKI